MKRLKITFNRVILFLMILLVYVSVGWFCYEWYKIDLNIYPLIGFYIFELLGILLIGREIFK